MKKIIIIPIFILLISSVLASDWCNKADLNNDLKVDFYDLAILSGNYWREDCSNLNNWCDGSDLNHDGKVNKKDLTKFNVYYGQTCVNWCERSDLNNDGKVDFFDLGILSGNFKKINCNENNWCNKADINHDRGVNRRDLNIFIQNYNQVC